MTMTTMTMTKARRTMLRILQSKPPTESPRRPIVSRSPFAPIFPTIDCRIACQRNESQIPPTIVGRKIESDANCLDNDVGCLDVNDHSPMQWTENLPTLRVDIGIRKIWHATPTRCLVLRHSIAAMCDNFATTQASYVPQKTCSDIALLVWSNPPRSEVRTKTRASIVEAWDRWRSTNCL